MEADQDAAAGTVPQRGRGPANLRLGSVQWCSRPKPRSLVEMAGIEPASRKFDQRCPTSLVGPKASRGLGQGQQAPETASRCVFGPAYRRYGSRSPT